MEYNASRDKTNPHWSALLKHVREMNGKLVELANFHLGNNVMSRLTNDNALPKATSSVASACLEVTDATCVIMATMRSIILKHNSEQHMNISTNNTRRDQSTTNSASPKTRLSASVSHTNQSEGILQYMEVALSLSKLKKEVEIVNLLEHAISLMKTKSPNKRCLEVVDNNVVESCDNNKCHAAKKVKVNDGDTGDKCTCDKPK